MSTTFIVQVIFALGLAGAYRYIQVVAASAAQKRDLDEITHLVRRVEAQYEHAVFVHRMQAQLEVDAYKNGWEALVVLDRAVTTYGRFPSDQPPTPEQYAAANQVEQDFTKFAYIIQSWRPFYSEQVYQALQRVTELFGDESIERATMGNALDADKLVLVAIARTEVEQAIQDVCDAIRSRLRALVVTDDTELRPVRPTVIVRAAGGT